jgi:hypothetical protein
VEVYLIDTLWGYPVGVRIIGAIEELFECAGEPVTCRNP